MYDSLLDNLKEHLEEIEKSWPEAHRFVEEQIIKREENRQTKLTDKQWRWLVQIHDQFIHGINKRRKE